MESVAAPAVRFCTAWALLSAGDAGFSSIFGGRRRRKPSSTVPLSISTVCPTLRSTLRPLSGTDSWTLVSPLRVEMLTPAALPLLTGLLFSQTVLLPSLR